MAYLIVNQLPSVGTVDRSLDTVYKWLESTYTFAPFDNLPTPVFHGYYMLSYEAIDPGDGFLPIPDALGWISIPAEDIPLESLPSIYSIDKVEVSPTIGIPIEKEAVFMSSITSSEIVLDPQIVYSIESSMDISEVAPPITSEGTSVNIGLEYYPVLLDSVSISVGKEYVTTTTDTASIYLSQYKLIFTGATVGTAVTQEYSKWAYISPIVIDLSLYAITFTGESVSTPVAIPERNLSVTRAYTIDLSEHTLVFTGEEIGIAVHDTEPNLQFAEAVHTDISSYRNTYTSPVTSDFSTYKLVFTSLELQVIIAPGEMIKVFSIPGYTDISRTAITYAIKTNIDISGGVNYKTFAQRTAIDFSGVPLLVTSAVHAVDIAIVQKTLRYTAAISSDISTTSAIDYGPTSSVVIDASLSSSIYATASAVDVVGASSEVYRATSIGIPVSSRITPPTLTAVTSILANASSKEVVMTSMLGLDISFSGDVKILTEQEWIMFKRFGTKGWKFLSYLDYYEHTEIRGNLPLDITTNYMSIMTASTLVDIEYDPVRTTDVTRLTRYADEAKLIKVEDVFIAYASGVPTEIKVFVYTEEGYLRRTVTEILYLSNDTTPVLLSGGVTVVVSNVGSNLSSSYLKMLSASSSTSVVLSVDGDPTSVIRYYDETQLDIAESASITYVNGSPSVSVVEQYDIYGNHLRTITETFTTSTLGILSLDTYTVTEIMPPPIASSYQGTDTPGNGSNTLDNTQVRVWTDTSVTPNKAYHVFRAANGEYHATELSNIEV